MLNKTLPRIKDLNKILLLLIIIWGLWYKSGILYAASDSLPYKFFWLIKKQQSFPQKNQLVAIDNHDTNYVHNVKFIKIVGGVAGDLITIVNHQIWINHTLIGKLRTHTNSQQPLTPIVNTIIPPGWIFVYATHPDSFDSRYREFGLVKIDKIIGKVIPLW